MAQLDEMDAAAPQQTARQKLLWAGALQQAAQRLGAVACGLAAGYAAPGGQLGGLGLGLVLGAPQPLVLLCAAGACLGLMARWQGVRAAALVCGVCAGAAVRALWPQKWGAAALAGAAAVAVGSLALGGRAAAVLLPACADGLAAALLGWGLRRSPPHKGGAGALGLAGTVFCALGALQPGGVPLGLAAAVPPCLALCARGLRQQALAAAMALAAALCAAGLPAPAAAGLCLGVLAAAYIGAGERARCLAGFAGGMAAALLYTPAAQLPWGALAAAALGAAGFCAIPRQWLLQRMGEAENAAESAGRPRLAAAATRLAAAAQSLAGIARTVNEVYEAMPRPTAGYRWVIDTTYDSLCSHCGRREACWQQEHALTLAGMEAARPLLEEHGHIEAARLPGQLARCVHPAALAAALTRSFAQYRSRQEAQVHAEAMRTALTEQYGAVAQALEALAAQLGEPGSPDAYKSGRVAAYFVSLGLAPAECAVTLDRLGRARATVTLPRTRLAQSSLALLAQQVGRICRRSFEMPQTLSCRGMTTLIFSEKPLLQAEFGMAGLPAAGQISGDAVQQFCSPTAAQMILCDGMGTGRPAAVDGNLAAELTARLLKVGFAAELAARLVNVALALKGDEGGATLDLLSVDLYTGTARLFKAGAAPSFVVQGGRARAIGGASLPVGVLGQVNGQSQVVRLAAGDLAVLVSDGVLPDGAGWVVQQLQLAAAAGESAQRIASQLVATARLRAVRTARPDDITAAVLRLHRAD